MNERLSTPELVRRAQAGSLPCFVGLVDRFEGRLYNFLLRRVGSAADAEDLTQETLVKAWEHLARYRPRWQFSTWLFTIGRRAAVSHLRRASRHAAAPLVVEPAARDTPWGGDPACRLAQREECRRLWDVADRLLPETQRSALWLRYAEELPVSEIARILGKTPVGVRVLLFRARQALAAHVSSTGPPPEVTDGVGAAHEAVAGEVS